MAPCPRTNNRSYSPRDRATRIWCCRLQTSLCGWRSRRERRERERGVLVMVVVVVVMVVMLVLDFHPLILPPAVCFSLLSLPILLTMGHSPGSFPILLTRGHSPGLNETLTQAVSTMMLQEVRRQLIQEHRRQLLQEDRRRRRQVRPTRCLDLFLARRSRLVPLPLRALPLLRRKAQHPERRLRQIRLVF